MNLRHASESERSKVTLYIFYLWNYFFLDSTVEHFHRNAQPQDSCTELTGLGGYAAAFRQMARAIEVVSLQCL